MIDFDPFDDESVAVEVQQKEEDEKDIVAPSFQPVEIDPVDSDNFDPFDEVDKERRFAANALDGDPLRTAESRALSERFQVSRTAADINHDDFMKQAQKDDAQTMLGETPFLTSWLASNPLDAPIFKNDIGVIKEIEDGFRKVGHLIEVDPYQKTKWDDTHGDYLGIYETEGMEDPENSTGNAELDHDIFMRRRPEFVTPAVRSAMAGLEAGYLTGEKGVLYNRALMNEISMDEGFKLRSQELDEAIEKATGAYGEDWLYSAGQVLGTMGSAFKNSTQGATLGGAFGLAGALATASTASAATGPFAGLTLAGLASLSLASGLADATMKIEGGLAYADMIKANTDPVKAKYISMGVGVTNAMIEMAGLHILGEAARPILKSAIARRGAKTVAALEDPSFMRALSQVGKAYAVGVGQEVVTEVMQEGVNVVGEEIARMWADGQQDPATVDAVVDRLFDIAVQTTKGAAVLGLAGLGAGATIQAKKVMQAQDTQIFFETLNGSIPSMQAKNISPDAVHEYIAAQAEETGNPITYIDAGEFHQAMIDTGVSMDELRAVVPEVADKLEQAALNGADIEISTADYATKLAGTKLGGQLTQSVRLSPDALSARDAIKVQQAYEAMRKELVKGTFDTEAAGNRFVESITNKKYKEKQIELERRYAAELKEATVEKGSFNEQEAHIQARLASGMVVNLAQRAGIPVERIEAIAPKLAVKNQVGKDEFHMPVTQGIEWHMGPTAKNAADQVPVVVTQKGVSIDRNAAIDVVLQVSREGILNKDSGFVLTASKSDLKKSVGGKNSYDETVFRVIANDFTSIVENAVRLESFRDVTHENPDVQGVHIFATPVAVDDKLFRIQLIIRDYVTPKQKRAAVHKIAGIQIFEIENPPMNTDGGFSDIRGVTAPTIRLVGRPVASSDHTISLSDLVGGRVPYVRKDGGGFFDNVDDGARQIGGVYYEPPGAEEGFQQRISTTLPSIAGTRGSFNVVQNSITLTPNANLSTFAHEMSHWYLDMLFKVSDMEGVSSAITEDVNTLLKEFGVESVEAWRAMSVDDQRKHHETFAAWTETYLAEGKAPTQRLERLLGRFAAWLKEVYQQFKDPREEIAAIYKKQFGTELPPISEEVRRVLDRMIASDVALEQAEAANGLKALFDQKPDGMSDEDWKEMMLARDEAEQEGAAVIAQARARDERWYQRARSQKLAEIQKKGEALKKTLREKISRKINGLPGVVALDLLKKGGSLGVETMKLDPDALWLLGYSEQKIAQLRSLGVFKKGTLGKQIAKMRKQGMTDAQIKEDLKVQAEQQISASRELLRPFARFNSNEKMIEAILASADRDQMIEDEVTRQAMAKHSEWFDEKKREDIVTKALHNEARARMVATELKYLLNDREGKSRVYREAARLAAIDMVAKLPIKAVSWKKFMAAESRASRKACECIKNGDRMGAVLAKRQQLIQHEAVVIAMGIEKKAAAFKATKKLVFGSDKKVAKSMDIDIVGVVRYIMTNSGFGKVTPSNNDPTVADKHVKHLGGIDEMKAEFFQSYVEQYRYKGGDIIPGNMTVESFEKLADDVAQLVGLAKTARQMKVKGRQENLENVVHALLEQTEKVDRKRFMPGKTSAVKPNEKATFSVLWWETQLLRVETWCRMMDGGKEGPFTKYIYRPVSEAAAKYRVENSKLQEKLVKLIREHQEAWAKQGSIDAHEIGYEFKTKQELIGALLHTGNQSNLEKLLLGGRGKDLPWADLIEMPDGSTVMSTERWDAFIARCYQEGAITKEDMDFCQEVWDLLESTKPAAQKAFKDIYGYNFVEIEPTPITTPFGVYRGGYVPAITTKYLVAEASTFQEIERITSQDYLRMMPVTTPGFAKTRARGYTEPLAFDISLLCSHVSKVMKFAYIAPAVYEVGKVVSDRGLSRALFELNPHFVDAMLKPWLKRAYTQSVSTGDSTWIDQKLNKLRSIAGMNIMAGHLLNALQQWTGLTVAMAKVSPKSIAKAAALISSGSVTIKDIIAKSSTIGSRLADRAIEYESEIARIASGENSRVDKAEGRYNKLAAIYEKGQPARDWIAQHGYFFQTVMQAPIDCIVWLAAYNEACVRGLSDVDAVAEADSVVRTTQSDFSPENIAGIEAGSALYRAFLVFYNYFGMQANLLAESWVTKDYGVFARDAVMIAYIPSILSAIIANMGFDFDDDDDVDAYDVLHLLIAEPFKNVMAMIPFLGSAVATALQNAAVSNTPVFGDIGQFLYGEDPYAGRLFSSPAIDLLSSGAKGVGDVVDIIAGEEVDARRATRNILDLTTLVTGIPMGAIKRPAGYIAGVVAGDYSADNAGDVVKGLVTGKGDE